MKPRVILLISSDPAVERAVENAVFHQRHGLRIAHTVREAMTILTDDLDDLDLTLLDMGKDMHTALLLAVMESRCREVPVVVLTNHEANYMRPIVLARGAAECLGKPVEAQALDRLITNYCAATLS